MLDYNALTAAQASEMASKQRDLFWFGVLL